MEAVLKDLNPEAKEGNKLDMGSYKDYIIANSSYLNLNNQLTQILQIEPSVAAYALFSTEFRSMDAAMNFIYERDAPISDNFNLATTMRPHPFVGCLPDSKGFKLNIYD